MALVANELEALRGKRVLVTGHTGFKGTWLTRILLNLDCQVTGVSLFDEQCHRHFGGLGMASRMNHQVLDIRDFQRLSEITRKARPEIIFHLAAQALVARSFHDPHTTLSTNVVGSLNVLEVIRQHCPGVTLVYVTSDKCYKNEDDKRAFSEQDVLGGSDPYSASKAAAEILFQSYVRSFFNKIEVSSASVRAGNVIGGGDWSADRLIPDAIRTLKIQDQITLRNPESTRPWQYVLEPILGYLMIAAGLMDGRIGSGESWNFGPQINDSSTVRHVSELILKFWGSGEICYLDQVVHIAEAQYLQLDSSKAQKALGWKTFLSLEETVEQTVNWYRRVQLGTPMDVVSDAAIEQYFKIVEERRSGD